MRIDIIQKIIDKCRKKKNHINPNPIFYGNKFIYSKNDATDLIINCIKNDKPISICRYNSVEYDIVKEFLTFIPINISPPVHIIRNKVVFLRTLKEPYKDNNMYWTLELASKLEDAPWPATKDELIDYAMRSGAPLEVIENLQELEDEGDVYETIEDVWPDYPTKEDFLFNEDEY